MEEMVERIARTLADHYMVDPETCWPSYESAARAAIEAMREPTNAMVWAHEVPHYGPDEAREAWRSMIDVALSKGERNG